MKFDLKYYNGIYRDMANVLGEEITKQVYEFYRGQQVTFPMKLYSKEYIQDYLAKKYTGENLKQLSRELGYSERWLKQLIDRYEIESK